MKRIGFLLEGIADIENLRLAFWKASRSKVGNREVIAYRLHLEENLIKLRFELLSGQIRVGDYHYFTIYDPKKRVICAASFPERVLHHAIMNVCHSLFERMQIFDSYATRIGKGQFAALKRAEEFTKKFDWFCKLDVHKYFDSIDHEVLKIMLRRKIKDQLLLTILYRIIDSYEVTMGKGLPIGNLTSQYFANLYLSYADRYAKERLKVQGYVRYMDDMILWGKDRKELLSHSRSLDQYIEIELKMALNTPCFNQVGKGVPFVGFVVFKDRIRLNKRSKKRFRNKLSVCNYNLSAGRWSQFEYAQHIQPLFAFTYHAQTDSYRRMILQKTGIV